MNYALLFVIILLCMGGYYEYSYFSTQLKQAQQGQQTASDQASKLADLQAQIDKLSLEKADLLNKLQVARSQAPAPTPVAPAPAATAAAPAAAAAAQVTAPPPGGLAADHVAQGIVMIKGDNAEGTGFLVKTADGPAIITNQHVLANNPHLHIQTTSGVELTPTGMKGATDRDLAMLTIADGPYTYLPLVTNLPSAVQPNDNVMTPGNSQGGDVVLSTPGQLVAVGPDRVEINNPIYHGNSGGPVFHVKTGTVIGVVTEAMDVDLSSDLDKTSFASRDSAIKTTKRYFALRLDTVPKWENIDLRQFENETAFLDNFEQQSERLDSFLNSKQDSGQSDDSKLYEKDDRIMTAWQSFKQRADGQDTGGRIDALRQLSFDLGAVADRDLTAIQSPGNFYSFNQQTAKEEADYRAALKKELEDFSSDVNRISDLPRSNN
jgi:S1-C subfamily serine protease